MEHFTMTSAKPPLWPHQEVAIDFIQNRKRAGLFLDMGMGKTRIVLEALGPEHLPALVIAPKRVAEETWPEDGQKWRPDLRLRVAEGSAVERLDVLRDTSSDVVVLSRDNLTDLPKVKREFPTVVLDELSSFKNKSTVRWRQASKRCKTATHVWGLTGTPAPNGYLDLWPQIYLLDNGQRLGTTITGFRERYFAAGRRLNTGVVIEWILRPEAENRVNEKLEDLCIGMGSDGRVEIPETSYVSREVPLPARVAPLYKEFAKELVVDLDILGGEIHSAANAAVLTSKLSQVTAGFMYVDYDSDREEGSYDVLHWEKIETLEEIVEFALGPVLVFYRFRAEEEMIRIRFPNARSIKERGIVKEWNEGKVPLLLAHPASAGHGLNLQYGGHTIVWTTQTWSLEEWQQANRRLARPGQQHPVQVFVLRCPGTVDGAIQAAIEQKYVTQDVLLDFLESPI